VRVALVALSLAALAAAAVLSARDRGDEATVPDWLARDLDGLSVRFTDPGELPVTRDFAVRAVSRSLFLDETPGREPLVLPLLVSGRFARSPLPVSPSGHVDIPSQHDVPAWAVAWQGLDGETLTRLGTWPAGSRVDVILLVDGVTGDCCFVSRFVAEPSTRAG
jgi:hypothetical protein